MARRDHPAAVWVGPDLGTIAWVVAVAGSGLYCGMGGPLMSESQMRCGATFTVVAARPPDQVGVFG